MLKFPCSGVCVLVCAHMPLCVREKGYTCPCVCEPQERICGILSFCYSLPHSLETEFLTEFKVRLAVRMPYILCCLHIPIELGYRKTWLHLLFFFPWFRNLRSDSPACIEIIEITLIHWRFNENFFFNVYLF